MRGNPNRHGMRGWPRKKGEGGSLVVLLLAQRAASEGPRWTRAVEDQSASIPEEIKSKLGGIYFYGESARWTRAGNGNLATPLRGR